ncbi:MAG: patatin-like phospholipase family protein [Bacteroidales bacterium]|nr:patatin-like phospholipase family protein [Bacteroidales bacterium]
MKHLYILIFFLLAFSYLSIQSFAQEIKDTVNTSTMHTINSMDEPIRIGLVLSGGGAKGLAHIGVLKVLEEEGIYVDYIGGTSMGGLVGGLYASGYSPWELDSITKSMPWTKLMSDESERSDLTLDEKKSKDQYLMSLPVTGFVPGLPKALRAGQLVLNYINKLTWPVADIKDFSKLPTPFFCVATKLETGDTMVLKNGELAVALRSTMSIPTIFEPVKYQGEVLIDGMMVNNFPVDVMKMNPDIDFIIGVDVGSPLLKVEEITSILGILEQTSSYHAYNRFLQNVKLTDLYLKPNVEDISALDFEDVEKVISRGEEIARANIDMIRALAKKARDNKAQYEKTREEKKPEMINLSEVIIDGLDRVPKNMILGRIGLNIPGVNNILHVNEAIDRLYSSNYFKSIDYKLEKQLNSYILKITVIEKSENLFEVGANYNFDLGANLKINFVFNNIIFKGSKTNLSIKMGNTPAGELTFLSERGKRVGFGLDLGYQSRPFLLYNSDYNSIVGKYYTRFANITAFGNINYSNNAVFQIGLDFEFFDVNAEVSPIPIADLGILYNNIYGKFTNDTYDNKYFPTEGTYFSAIANVINVGRPESGIYSKIKIGTVFNITKRLAFLPKIFIGGLWSEHSATEYAYYYILGGGNESDYSNSVYMPGVPFSASVSNNISVTYLDFRYQLWDSHYIFLKPSAALTANFFEELITNSTFISAATLGYTYKSPIGPVGVQFGTSNLNSTLVTYLFIGMDI